MTHGVESSGRFVNTGATTRGITSPAFSTITHIQRLDTVSGVAPAEGCDEAHAGEEVRAPYEATYTFFYPAMAATPGAGSTA